jgi:hypothetical protein
LADCTFDSTQTQSAGCSLRLGVSRPEPRHCAKAGDLQIAPKLHASEHGCISVEMRLWDTYTAERTAVGTVHMNYYCSTVMHLSLPICCSKTRANRLYRPVISLIKNLDISHIDIIDFAQFRTSFQASAATVLPHEHQTAWTTEIQYTTACIFCRAILALGVIHCPDQQSVRTSSGNNI